MDSKIVKQIDSYDIWQDSDGFRVMAANASQPDRLVAAVDTLQAAIRQVRIDMMNVGDRW
jgi:hypothetical protein